MDCVFCKIIHKELPAQIVYEDNKVMAFKDIHPKASYHILLVPKEHIESVNSERSEEKIKDLIFAVKHIISKEGISDYKLVFNVGKKAGQTIEHLHMHCLAGTNIQMP